MNSLHDLEVAAVVGVQRYVPAGAARRGSHVLGRVGEHAIGWIALGLLGATADPPRRREWLEATAIVVGAHAVSVVLKRVVRRRRPGAPEIRVLDTAPSAWSFPSSHAASTAAAAVVYSRLLGHRWLWALVPAMMASRVALGVHYPSDVAAGSAVGVAMGRWLAPRPVGTRT